jgi:hypothetical protein
MDHCTVNCEDSRHNMSHSKVEVLAAAGAKVFYIMHNNV